MTSDDPQHSSDGRHIVVNGRKWRATDPAIPESLRVELVAELMDARRAVHRDRSAPERVLQARSRVSHAKHALGERGEAWWVDPTESGLERRIQSTMLALTTKRGTEKTICPSEVARVVSSPDWRPVMDRVRQVAQDLATSGDVTITRAGAPVDPRRDPGGPIRIGVGPRNEQSWIS